MKLVYDHQVFSLQDAGGASRYHFELAFHLSSVANVHVTAYIGFNRSVHRWKELRVRGVRVLSYGTRMRPGLVRYGVNEAIMSTTCMIEGQYDIYHPTLYRHMPLIKSRRVVATHHDCVHERFPQLFPKRKRVMLAKKRLYEKADAIICVSESSRNDLMQFYDVAHEKVHMVHHGITPFVVTASDYLAATRMFPRPYFLYVGARHAYKNFRGLLHSFAMGGFSKDFDLIVIGGGEFTHEERSQIHQLAVEKSVRQVEYASESFLAAAYARATLLVYPSLYEGFGFPPLEAMSVGCPVLAANNGAVAEVCGDAASYFPLSTCENFAQDLDDAINSLDREDRILRGYQRVAKYTWQASTANTLKIYSSL